MTQTLIEKNKLERFITKQNRYKALPAKNMLFEALIFMAFINGFRKKNRKIFHYLGPEDYIDYYIFYIKKGLIFHIQRIKSSFIQRNLKPVEFL